MAKSLAASASSRCHGQIRLNLTRLQGSCHYLDGIIKGDWQRVAPAKMHNTSGVGFINGRDVKGIDDVSPSFDVH